MDTLKLPEDTNNASSGFAITPKRVPNLNGDDEEKEALLGNG